MIDTIIFDFGGTIDTDGIHWIEKFWSVYQNHSINITKEQFIDAYIYAERRMNEKIKPDDSFKTTLYNQVSLQFEYLDIEKILIASEAKIFSIRDECYTDSKKNIRKFIDVISKIEKDFTFAVVSNFYGNLENVLKEFDIYHFFKIIVDSTLVNIRKPDCRIFYKALEGLSKNPSECYVVGDSFENDIKPAKKIGCSTIWLMNKTYIEDDGQCISDFKISSISRLLEILKS